MPDRSCITINDITPNMIYNAECLLERKIHECDVERVFAMLLPDFKPEHVPLLEHLNKLESFLETGTPCEEFIIQIFDDFEPDPSEWY